MNNNRYLQMVPYGYNQGNGYNQGFFNQMFPSNMNPAPVINMHLNVSSNETSLQNALERVIQKRKVDHLSDNSYLPQDHGRAVVVDEQDDEEERELQNKKANLKKDCTDLEEKKIKLQEEVNKLEDKVEDLKQEQVKVIESMLEKNSSLVESIKEQRVTLTELHKNIETLRSEHLDLVKKVQTLKHEKSSLVKDVTENLKLKKEYDLCNQELQKIKDEKKVFTSEFELLKKEESIELQKIKDEKKVFISEFKLLKKEESNELQKIKDEKEELEKKVQAWTACLKKIERLDQEYDDNTDSDSEIEEEVNEYEIEEEVNDYENDLQDEEVEEYSFQDTRPEQKNNQFSNQRNVNPQTYTCNFCSKSYARSASMRQHFQTCVVVHYPHLKELTGEDLYRERRRIAIETNAPVYKKRRIDDIPESEKWTCEICSKQYTKNSSHIKFHRILHENFFDS
jgi:hypothetical protein